MPLEVLCRLPPGCAPLIPLGRCAATAAAALQPGARLGQRWRAWVAASAAAGLASGAG